MPDSITLKVARAKSQNEAGYGRARMDEDARRALGLELGDTVEIKGKRAVVARVFKCDPEDEGRGLIFIDGLTRTGAGVSVDESVEVRRCEPKPASRIVLAPNIPDGKKIRFEEDIERIFLKGLLYRPLVADTDIIVPNIALTGNRSIFTVVSTDPTGPVKVVQDTVITLLDKPIRSGDAPRTAGHRITYDDVGGLDDVLKRIREMVELPMKHPELFERLGIGAPKGVLLYGPPGTGKTLLAEAVANESGATLFSVRGPEIMGQYYGQSEERLREIFKEAEKKAPSIVFLDEIDSIAPSREDASGEVERRVVAQLLTLMDGLGKRGNVIVIGATNREDSIDPALRRPGRFDREIEIGIPNAAGRAQILSVHMRDMPIAGDVTPDRLASVTQGFVGADLAALCREAAMHCLSSRMESIDLDKAIPSEILESMQVTWDDFSAALAEVEPSGMREVLVEIPKVTWDDVGGLDDVRRRIEECFVPEGGSADYDRLGIDPGRGILLYGPPGTGKTLIAKALANESGSNFISVNGPEIVSKWFGESERAVRQIFKKARQMAPCIVFFDELDSIAPARGSGEGGGTERIVAQLLTSMDGVGGLNGVTVMGATNRPDMIDPALLRPGRFDNLVLVGQPDRAARLAILEVHSRRMPLEGVDLGAVADATDGYTGADLSAVCREAGLCAYREDRSSEKVLQRHFDAALKEIGPSVTPMMMRSYEDIGKSMRKRKTSWSDNPFYGRSQVLRHVRELLGVSEGAVVPADADAAGDPYPGPPGISGDPLGLGDEPPAEPAVLHVAVLAYRGGMAEHLQLPYGGLRAVVQPEPRVADDPVAALERYEVLGAARCLVDRVLQLGGVQIDDVLRAAGLPAAYAPARTARVPHPRQDDLADVALAYACGDLGGRYVPLDPLDADVLGDDGLHPRQQVRGGVRVVRHVLPVPPHVVDLRPLDDQQGVELEHVRAVGGVVEHPPEAFEVVLRAGSGEAGHDVVAYLEAVVLAPLRAVAHLGGAVAPVHSLQDVVVEDLDAELHPGGAQPHRPHDLLVGEHIRTGLHRHPDAAVGGGLVQPLGLLQGVRVRAVHRVEAALHEPLLVLRLAAGERPAHDDEVYLPGAVADLLQLTDAVGDLHPGVEQVPRGPPGGGLLPRVRLRGAVGDPAGTVGAPAVGAVVRRGHHRHRGDAADGAGRLLDEKGEHQPPVGVGGAGEDLGIGGNRVQAVPLAQLQLQVLKGVAVADRSGPGRRDQVRREEVYGLSHTGRSRRPSSWAPRERAPAVSGRLSSPH